MKGSNIPAPTRVLEDSLLVSKPVGEEEDGPQHRLREEICVPSPDSAISLSNSSEEIAESSNKSNTTRLNNLDVHPPPQTPSESSSSGVASTSSCDSSDNSAIVDDTVPGAARHPHNTSDSDMEEEEVEVKVKTNNEMREERTTGGKGEEKEKEGEGKVVEPSHEELADMNSLDLSKGSDEAQRSDVTNGKVCNDGKKLDNLETSGDGDERVGAPAHFELH